MASKWFKSARNTETLTMFSKRLLAALRIFEILVNYRRVSDLMSPSSIFWVYRRQAWGWRGHCGERKPRGCEGKDACVVEILHQPGNPCLHVRYAFALVNRKAMAARKLRAQSVGNLLAPAIVCGAVFVNHGGDKPTSP